jgi:hypothetical protein
MANRWCDGFGRYGGDESKMLDGSSGSAWAELTGGAAGYWFLSNANPRTGNWHMRLDGNPSGDDCLMRRVFGAAKTEVFFGQALYFDQLPVTEPVIGGNSTGFFLAKFRTNANAPMISIYLGTDGSIVAYRGGDPDISNHLSGTLLGRSDPAIGAGAYVHVEHYLKVGNSDGAYECRVNEVTVLNLTGIDTDNGGGEVSQVTVGRRSGPFAGGKNVDMADCFVNDTTVDGSACDTFVGDCKCGVTMVDADTAQADFAKSTGTVGYSLLNEIPPVDGGYISLASATGSSNFGIQDGPANMSEILTARPFYRAMKDDAGTCTIEPNLKSGGVKATLADQPVTTAFAYHDSNVPLDPNTGVPWTPAGFNAALEVVERIS